jgi:hypothetical protein
MDKSEWFRTNKGLCVAAARITAGAAALLSRAQIHQSAGQLRNPVVIDVRCMLFAELKKLGAASRQLSNLDAAGLASQAQRSALFATVADAKLRLAALQKQVNAQRCNHSLAPSLLRLFFD